MGKLVREKVVKKKVKATPVAPQELSPAKVFPPITAFKFREEVLAVLNNWGGGVLTEQQMYRRIYELSVVQFKQEKLNAKQSGH